MILQSYCCVKIKLIKIILPYIGQRDKQELLTMAESLSRSDLKHELVVTQVKQVKPDFVELPKIYACLECKKVKGLYIRDLCHCGKPPTIVEFINKHLMKY